MELRVNYSLAHGRLGESKGLAAVLVRLLNNVTPPQVAVGFGSSFVM